MVRVGVLTDGSSVRASSVGFESGKKLLFGRGVVGVVVPSPGRADGRSGTVSMVLTARNVDMVAERGAREVDNLVFRRGLC